MKLQMVLLVVMLAVGCSVLMWKNTASAEQGAAQKIEGSHGAQAVPECCQKKETRGEGQEQNAKDTTCCDDHEGSHGAGHEGSHGKEDVEEGSH